MGAKNNSPSSVAGLLLLEYTAYNMLTGSRVKQKFQVTTFLPTS